MTDNEKNSATDNEIIKALKCLQNETNCRECVLYKFCPKGKCVFTEALDLINRQKEQIEGLIAGQETLQKALNEKIEEVESLKRRLHNSKLHQKETHKALQDERALRLKEEFIETEAVKECLEWVLSLFPEDKNFTTISRFTVNQKLKEMVGETDA